MQLVQRGHEFEYRDPQGIDRLAEADVYASSRGDRAVLVLRRVDGGLSGDERAALLENARRALQTLASSLLPFLVPHARLEVLILRPPEAQFSAGEAPEALCGEPPFPAARPPEARLPEARLTARSAEKPRALLLP